MTNEEKLEAYEILRKAYNLKEEHHTGKSEFSCKFRLKNEKNETVFDAGSSYLDYMMKENSKIKDSKNVVWDKMRIMFITYITGEEEPLLLDRCHFHDELKGITSISELQIRLDLIGKGLNA